MKNILITGGSSGVGNELVKLFSICSVYSVTTCSRNKEKNQILSSTSECVDASTVDLGNSMECSKFIQEFLISKDSLNALVLNAAVTGMKEIDQADNSEKYVREVNISANKEILNKTLPLLRKSNGIVVFLSSGIFNEKDHDQEIDLYAQTKKEFEDYITKISNDPENKNVKFIIIRPGMLATRLHQRILKIGSGNLFERTKKAVENRQLRNANIVAKIIKDYIDNPEKVLELIHPITQEEYQNYAIKAN